MSFHHKDYVIVYGASLSIHSLMDFGAVSTSWDTVKYEKSKHV